MPLDYDALLYDPIYSALGVDAVIDLGTDGEETIRVIDKTAGVEVGDGVTVSTISPACDVRMSELTAKGITREDVNASTITFSGKTWAITSHILRPSPRGEDKGELRMVLSE